MKKHLFTLVLVFITAIGMSQTKTLYDFTVKDIDGNTFDMSKLKGKKVLIVNTASKCGLTPQYEDLEELYKTYGGDKFEIIAFPANNFAGQEPGTNTEIKAFCTENYGVSFPVMSKISVKGEDMHPLYKWLTGAEKNDFKESEVSWNFQKYLIGEDGKIIAYFTPTTNPMSKEIIELIK
ncbi:MAG: glutathione peroxidase [Hyphomicrobiales bacterium]